MDLTQRVEYRGFALNDVTQQDGRLVGCQLAEAQWLGVQGVGYTEKRSQGDGNDSADVFLGPRRLQLIGTLYGDSRADLFDRMRDLVATFTPTLAYADAPGDRGYQALFYEVPTLDIANFSTGFRSMFVNVRPISQPNEVINRDRIGGVAANGASVPWAVQLDAVDPIQYVVGARGAGINLTGTPQTATVAAVNRGNYPAPVSLVIVVTGGTGVAVVRLAVGGADVTFTCPAAAVTYEVEYDALTGLTYIADINGVRTLAADLLTVNTEVLRPAVPPGGGNLDWDIGIGHGAASLSWHESFV